MIFFARPAAETEVSETWLQKEQFRNFSPLKRRFWGKILKISNGKEMKLSRTKTTTNDSYSDLI